MARKTHRGLIAAGAVVMIAAIAAAAFIAPRRGAEPIPPAELKTRYATPESRFVEVAGVTVHYRDEGTGPALLLVHGSYGNLHSFDGMLPLLRERYRVIRFDQAPGGLSGTVPDGFNLTPEAFTRAFLEKIGVDRVAVLGNSSGGIFAYRYAATYPEDVYGLVLTNVPPSAPVDNAAARRRRDWYSRLSSTVCEWFSGPQSRTCWRDFLYALFVRDEQVTEDLVTQYFEMNRKVEARRFTTMTAIMREDDKVIDFLARVRAPTLLLWGTHSPVLPPPTMQILQSRLTGTRVETQVLQNVGHYPPLEAPREVAEATDEFLRRVLAEVGAAPTGGATNMPTATSLPAASP